MRYETEGFLDKNKDLVWKDLVLIGCASELGAFKEIYAGTGSMIYFDSHGTCMRSCVLI